MNVPVKKVTCFTTMLASDALVSDHPSTMTVTASVLKTLTWLSLQLDCLVNVLKALVITLLMMTLATYVSAVYLIPLPRNAPVPLKTISSSMLIKTNANATLQTNMLHPVLENASNVILEILSSDFSSMTSANVKMALNLMKLPESVPALKVNILSTMTPVFGVMLPLAPLFLKMEPVDVLKKASSTTPSLSAESNAPA